MNGSIMKVKRSTLSKATASSPSKPIVTRIDSTLGSGFEVSTSCNDCPSVLSAGMMPLRSRTPELFFLERLMGAATSVTKPFSGFLAVGVLPSYSISLFVSCSSHKLISGTHLPVVGSRCCERHSRPFCRKRVENIQRHGNNSQNRSLAQ